MRFSLEKYPVQRRALEGRELLLELPLMPPSTNNLYASIPGGRRVKTRRYEDWLHQCGLLLNPQIGGRIQGRVDISIEAEDKHPQRDVSNIVKPLEDLLVKCGVIHDDRAAYVRSVRAAWAPIKGIRIKVARV